MRLQDFDAARVRALFGEMEREATRFVRSCDADAAISTDHKIYMRYTGQGWEIPVQLTAEQAGNPDAETFLALFEADYADLFGRAVDGMEVEITVWSVNAYTQPAEATPLGPMPEARTVAGEDKRNLFDPGIGERVRADVVKRQSLGAGGTVQGPAVVTEDETTIVVPTSREVVALADGTLDVRRKAAPGEPAGETRETVNA
jgi:N-methylhydantoinase A